MAGTTVKGQLNVFTQITVGAKIQQQHAVRVELLIIPPRLLPLF